MQNISTTDLAHRLRPVLTRLARRMRQEAGGDLTPTQQAALATISCHGPLTPSELASRERIQRPTATRVLALLEERGLVARTADPADGRSSLVSATGAGDALLASVRDRKDLYLARHLDGLSAEELAALDRAAEILERVLAE
jgi:DNA-binding MarR family transcriptional regulator